MPSHRSCDPDPTAREPAALDLDPEPNPEADHRSTAPVSEPPGDASSGERGRYAPGRLIKHYEIVRELGHGGMGRVLLARDLRLARPCAIKFLFSPGADAGRLLAEARATARCRHDGIVTIYEVDEIDGAPYMVLEYLEGQTLRAWLAARGDTPVPPRTAALLVVPVIRAVACAHDIGIVHRDLKPENIFLTRAGPIKVLDFGIATSLDDAGGGGPARAGARVGTRSYMSPEQWLGREVDARSDVWALGVILHELVIGAHPLAPARSAELADVRDLDRPMPSARHRPELGPIGEIIDRCLHKRPAERTGSARELLAQLAPIAAEPAEPAEPPRSGHRRRIAAAIAAGAAIAGAASAIAAIAARPGAPGPAPAGATAAQPAPPSDEHRGAESSGGASPQRPPPASGPDGQRGAVSPGAITAQPSPPSRSPGALAAYAAALHGFRDASWTAAEVQLRRAVELDPALAAAHLRLAMLRNYTNGRTPDARRSFALATQGRAALDPRDRDLLAAFEHLFAREPPELARFTAALDELARRRAGDAEIQHLVAMFTTADAEAQLAGARRAIAIDPGYADAWQTAGKQLFALGRPGEALRAFDACLAVSPAATDCLGERAQLHAAAGRCAAAEADLHNAAAIDPASRYWRDVWASSLIELGKPVDAAIEVLRAKWAAQPDDRRAQVELDDRARLDLLRGRFDDARDRAQSLAALVDPHSDADQHAHSTGLRIDIAVETGRLDVAARLADDYLQRRAAWVSAGNILDELAMLTVLRDAGRLADDRFAARRAAWLADHRDLTGTVRHQIWLAAWARPARTRSEAQQALAAAPAGDHRALARSLADHAALGALLLHAGRAADAIPLLERAALGCDGMIAPADHVRAAAQLGRAREATGDRAGACAAYQRVLDRWSAPSRTAADARRRSAALGCPAPRALTAPSPRPPPGRAAAPRPARSPRG